MSSPSLNAGGTRPGIVLVVDGNSVSRRFVELALSRFEVESVSDAASALEVLQTQVVDLIISETMLTDMNGLRFFRRLRAETRLRAIPFFFLSSESKVETKIIALHAGVDDYLTKPCDAGELAARVQSIIERTKRKQLQAWSRTYTLAGDFSAMSFPDLVASMEMGQRTGVLSVLSNGVGGQVFFEKGRAVHARYGNLIGPKAFFHFVWQIEGQFELTSGALELGPDERTLSEPAMMLIMEAARIADTARLQGDRGAEFSQYLLDTLPTPMVPRTCRVEGPTPDVMIAALYEMAIRDPYSLGDLKFLNETDLSAWTQASIARDRVHMTLIASLPEAISALLPLAGALTERLIIDGLDSGRKALVLAFFLRDERLLDIVVIDGRDPSVLLSSLRRVPSVVLFAPPHGDFMALGTQSQSVLATMLDALSPPAVMGIGLPTLEDALGRLGIRSKEGRVLRCLNAVLGDPSCDFRHLLVSALRLWTAGDEPQTQRGKLA
ncbi:MAG TPA: response regulator [Polyangiaceae bacterium]